MHSSLRNILFAIPLTAALASALPLSGAQIVTNWIAYNDHRPGPLIPPFKPVATNWGTALNVTTYDMRVGPAGNLTNILNGQQLPVTLTVTAGGAPDDFGECSEPNTNTPASDIFFGDVDVGNLNSVIGVRFSAQTTTTLTFNNLNPAKHYVFRGTSIRRGGYALRWTVATLIGANGWVDAHMNGTGPGVITSNNFPADLGPGQAAYDSGDNSQGAVVGWDFITPSPDGSFSVESSNYVGHVPGGQLADNTRYGYAISALLLAEVETAPPLVVTNPPAQTTVEQNRTLALNVDATGTPLFYQWYKQGVGQIAGATLSTYTVAQAALSDSGNYFVVVYNPLSSVTSTVAHVTVNPDVTPPGVNTAFSYPTFDFANPQTASLNQVIVEFNEVVQAASAGDRLHYTISGGSGNPASVTITNNRTVVLNLSTPLAADTAYTVQVSGVLDLVGNNINSGGANNPAPFRTWAQGLGGGLAFEYYDTGAGATVDLLTNSPVFPGSPSFRTNLWAFDSRVVFSDDSHTAYGSRIRGVFIPPVSGEWVFFLRTFDRGNIYLNPNGLDPDGRQLILAEVTGNNPRDWNKFISDSFKLQAGQGYYIEGLQKVDTGPSVIRVAARLVGTGLPTLGIPDADTAVDTNSLGGSAVAWPYAPRDLGGPLTIRRDLLDLTVEEGHIVNFTVVLSNTSRLPLSYQWFKDGVPVDGANGPVYSFAATALDGLSLYKVQVSKIGSIVTSREASLTVSPDTTPPHAIDASSSPTNLTTILVEFDEPVDMGEANDLFSYTLPGFNIVSATLQPDQQTVALGLDISLTLGTTYQLHVEGVSDLAGHSMTATTLTFVAGAGPRLRVTRAETFADISWPASYTGFVLEQASDLAAGWTRVADAPVSGNGRNTVTVAIDPGTTFFRLRQ